MSAIEFARAYVERLRAVLDALPMESIGLMTEAIESARCDGRQVFIVGNGGSAATASHMMTDLSKGILGRNIDPTIKRLRVISLTDNVSLLTAWANDTDYTHVFSEPLQGLASRGDVLIAISASGSSPNVLAAVTVARQLGMTVLALTGFGGGELAATADVAVIVPCNEYGPVEDAHLIINHLIAGFVAQSARGGA